MRRVEKTSSSSCQVAGFEITAAGDTGMTGGACSIKIVFIIIILLLSDPAAVGHNNHVNFSSNFNADNTQIFEPNDKTVVYLPAVLAGS